MVMGGGTGLYWIIFLVLPALVGAVVALAKPPEFVAWINTTSAWWHNHYSVVKAKDGLIADLWGWLIWGVYKLHQGTEAIEDEAHRAGARFALFFFVASVSVIIIASLLYLAFILAVIAIGIWIFAAIFGDGDKSSPDEDYNEREPRRRKPTAAREGRSVRREDWLGSEYTEHLDRDGRSAGRSEVKKDWLGNAYVETTNADGEVVETSSRGKDWLGADYVEHRNADGEKSGESRNSQDWLGNEYVEHRDADGIERGRSTKRSDWLGNDYTEHEPRE
jgi:hypothetical protein